MIGTIQANNTEDPNSRDSIECGYIIGTGLIGRILSAVVDLSETTEEVGYCNGVMTEELARREEGAWSRLYDVLKELEQYHEKH